MKIKALLFAAAAMVGISAVAQVPAGTNIYFDPFEADPGQKVIVKMKLDSPNPTMCTFQFDLVYPEGMTAAKLTKNEAFGSGNATTQKLGFMVPGCFLDESEEEAGDAFQLAINEPNNADLRMLCSPNLDVLDRTFGAQDGAEFAAIAIQVADDMAPGTYEISFPHTVISGRDGAKVGGVLDPYTISVTVKGEVTPTAVTDINAKAVAGVKYYNLAGVESNKPFDGVNVVVTTYTDGTKAASKVIK